MRRTGVFPLALRSNKKQRGFHFLWFLFPPFFCFFLKFCSSFVLPNGKASNNLARLHLETCSFIDVLFFFAGITKKKYIQSDDSYLRIFSANKKYVLRVKHICSSKYTKLIFLFLGTDLYDTGIMVTHFINNIRNIKKSAQSLFLKLNKQFDYYF